MNAQNHEELKPLVEQLRALWGMENAILKKMPAMIEQSNDMGLKNVLRLHFAETLNQTSALRGIFKQLELSAEGEANQAIADILKEISTFSSFRRGVDLDLKIIAVAQRIELFEIDQYMTAIANAESHALHGIEKTLLVILNEEKLSGVKLDFLKRNIEEYDLSMHDNAIQQDQRI
jgi:ferritin-like metal-binding protein YciE